MRTKTSPTEAAQLTEEHQCRRVVVLTPAERLIGIVSLSDLAVHTDKELVPTAISSSVSTGLLDYPVLQAADILL
jgi:CBS-domain-containing membrane protein